MNTDQLFLQFDPAYNAPIDARLECADITARNAIPSAYRYQGMIVYVYSDATLYTLDGGITNSDWRKVTTKKDNIITVAKGGGEYETIGEAVSNITGNTATNPMMIFVAPGYYEEDPIVIPHYVKIEGHNVIVKALNNASPLFSMNDSCFIDRVQMMGPTNNACIYTNTTDNAPRVENCLFLSGLQGLHVSGVSARAVVEECKVLDGIIDGIVADGGARIDCSSIFSYADRTFYANGGSIWVHNSGAETGSVGLESDNGGYIKAFNFSTESVDELVKVNNASTIEGNIVSAKGDRIYDVNQQDVNSVVDISGGRLNTNKLRISNWDNVTLYYSSDEDNERGYKIGKELYIGHAEYGRESTQGSGEEFTRGMLVYEYDGTSYTDVSADASTQNNVTVGIPNVNVDSALYISCDLQNTDFIKFFGVYCDVSTSMVLGGGNVVLEYWNGTAWVSLTSMTCESTGKRYSKGENFFQDVGGYNTRFNRNMDTDWAKNDPVSSGTDRYWIRFRVETAITTVPAIDLIKLHPNSKKVADDGYTEMFGLARYEEMLSWDYGRTQPFDLSPGDQDLYISDYLGVGRIENSFKSNASRLQGFNTFIPYSIDTSCPLKFKFSVAFNDDSSGDGYFNIRAGFTNDTDYPEIHPISGSAPTVGPNERIIPVIVSSPLAQGHQVTVIAEIPISDIIARKPSDAGDILWISIEREGGNVLDTYNDNIYIINIAPYMVKWCEGGHI